MTYILPSGEVIDETRREFYDRHVFYDGGISASNC